ncbi:tetratricopeptide repeat protein [Paenibacillus sp. MAHUQ-46]|uniref:Tetratricopeptide repeat protein n=2 Tax=Paenibacillus TaxID=44249 RepID=A0A934JB38_9BACL|nr:tetratricopeptide repeat protein [Paenibacillus roseus]MBJ6363568.1 tetratricopeptide repeat protein [Paenibacillus roseus]
MFSHLFATMNELLDELIKRNPNGVLQGQDEEQFAVLKAMSDKIMDEWLSFEEKIALFKDKMQDSDAEKTNNITMPLTAVLTDKPPVPAALQAELEQLLSKGQGYFKLYMFPEAADAFNEVMQRSPDCNLARLFLAMTYMHMQEWYEAQRHFQLIVALADHPKWQALGLNALGCIQAIRQNLDQAEIYFQKAYDADPSFEETLSNLHACKTRDGQLSLYFGSAKLSCL